MIGNRFRGFALAFMIGISGPGVECTFAQGEKVPDAREAVDRHIAAIGGREALEAARTTHLWLTLTAFGLTGRTEVWLAAPARRAPAVPLGPFPSQEGSTRSSTCAPNPTRAGLAF